MLSLLSKSSESSATLSTLVVLLGQRDCIATENTLVVALDCSKESTVTIHDDESIPLFTLQLLLEAFGTELAVTAIGEHLQRLDRLECSDRLAGLVVIFRGVDTTKESKSIFWESRD